MLKNIKKQKLNVKRYWDIFINKISWLSLLLVLISKLKVLDVVELNKQKKIKIGNDLYTSEISGVSRKITKNVFEPWGDINCASNLTRGNFITWHTAAQNLSRTSGYGCNIICWTKNHHLVNYIKIRIYEFFLFFLYCFFLF